jgi:hypothetical protein
MVKKSGWRRKRRRLVEKTHIGGRQWCQGQRWATYLRERNLKEFESEER